MLKISAFLFNTMWIHSSHPRHSVAVTLISSDRVSSDRT